MIVLLLTPSLDWRGGESGQILLSFTLDPWPPHIHAAGQVMGEKLCQAVRAGPTCWCSPGSPNSLHSDRSPSPHSRLHGRGTLKCTAHLDANAKFILQRDLSMVLAVGIQQLLALSSAHQEKHKTKSRKKIEKSLVQIFPANRVSFRSCGGGSGLLEVILLCLLETQTIHYWVVICKAPANEQFVWKPYTAVLSYSLASCYI